MPPEVREREVLRVCQGVPPLDPLVIRLIDALARAQAKEDHERENSLPPAAEAS
jgi:hypothetical protein